MFFRQRPAANATLSYFFGCAGLAKAIAVDVVAGDEDWFMTAEIPPQPQEMASILEANRRGRAAALMHP